MYTQPIGAPCISQVGEHIEDSLYGIFSLILPEQLRSQNMEKYMAICWYGSHPER